MITILGQTACGKTKFAAHLAYKLDGEIISADSRQVYKGMNIGTGKDYDDYKVNNKTIPCHLIDIVEPGYEYNVYEYKRDFFKAYNDIKSRNKIPVLCGGTGMYIEAVLKNYKLINVPYNKPLRDFLKNKSDEELIEMLSSFKKLHNITDTSDRNRLIKAIEIQKYYKEHPELNNEYPEINNIIFGIFFDRKVIKQRITKRLEYRLKNGLIEEVKSLLDKGISAKQLKFYGLEYKFITKYITGEFDYYEMFKLLDTAIHQFAKRQTTWLRRMQKNGFKINWIDGELSLNDKIDFALRILRDKSHSS